MRAARTYFTRKNLISEKDVHSILDDYNVPQVYEIIDVKNPNFNDESLLLNIYHGLLFGFQEIMQNFAKDYRNLTEEFCRNMIFKKIQRIYEKLNLGGIDVHLKCYNSFGEEGKIDFKDTISFKLSPVIYILRFEILNI